MLEENDNSSSSDDSSVTPTHNEDGYKQIKGEMHRKFDKVSDQIAAQADIQRQLLEQIRALTTPAVKAAPQEDMEALRYSNPAKHDEMLIQRAEERVTSRLSQQNQTQAQTQSVISELVADYPEYADANDPLTRRAVEILQQLPAHEKTSPAAIRAAGLKAAVEMDVKPRSKRTAEDFIDSGSGSSGRAAARRTPSKLDPGTEEFARAIGLNMEDPVVKARVLERSKRDWKTPTTPMSTKKRKG